MNWGIKDSTKTCLLSLKYLVVITRFKNRVDLFKSRGLCILAAYTNKAGNSFVSKYRWKVSRFHFQHLEGILRWIMWRAKTRPRQEQSQRPFQRVRWEKSCFYRHVLAPLLPNLHTTQVLANGFKPYRRNANPLTIFHIQTPTSMKNSSEQDGVWYAEITESLQETTWVSWMSETDLGKHDLPNQGTRKHISKQKKASSSRSSC